MNFSTQKRLFVLAFLLAGFLTAPAHSQDQADKPVEKPKLTRKIKQKLQHQILPAIDSEDQAALLDCLLPIIKSSPKQLAVIEEFCDDNNLPSVRKAFADALLARVEQGIDVNNAINSVDAGFYVGNEILNKIQSRIDSINRHAVMKTPLVVDQSFDKSEELFWNVRVLNSDLETFQQVTEFGTAVVDKFSKRLMKSDKARQFVTDFENAMREFGNLSVEVKDRSADLRLQRFDWATEELKSQRGFYSKFTAAMCQERDGHLLIEYLAKTPFPSRTSLQQPGLAGKIQETLDDSHKKNGELAAKAQLFRNGLHYWLRGRYGNGPLEHGMLKHKQAVNNPSVMEALYMPRERPWPISAYHESSESSEGYERRHMATWAAEYRPFIKSIERGPSNEGSATRTEVLESTSTTETVTRFL